MRRLSRMVLALWGILTFPAALADPVVRIYTNADLEDLPLPRDPAPAEVAADPAQGWAFVADHLEREQRRLEAEWAYEQERARLEEAASVRQDFDFVPLPYASFCVHSGRREATFVSPRDPGGAKGFRDPRPLHAGPTHAQQHRARAIRNKGSDAFPN